MVRGSVIVVPVRRLSLGGGATAAMGGVAMVTESVRV